MTRVELTDLLSEIDRKKAKSLGVKDVEAHVKHERQYWDSYNFSTLVTTLRLEEVKYDIETVDELMNLFTKFEKESRETLSKEGRDAFTGTKNSEDDGRVRK